MADFKNGIRGQHLDDFRKSGISDFTIESLIKEGYLESHEDFWKLYYPELLEDKKSDYYTIRQDNPPKDENGKVQGKYKRPEGQPSRVYKPPALNPEILQDTEQYLIITEGEKKAIKAAEMGYNCVSIAGVYCFLDSHNEEDRLIPDMHKISWKGRRVYLVFDNDIYVKEQVQKALIKFASILISKFQAEVYNIYLPDYRTMGKKLGLDDYLKEYGTDSFTNLKIVQITLDNARTLFSKDDKITFPVEIFQGKTKEFVIKSSRVLDAPVEFIACSLIAGAAILINSKCNIIIKKDWIEPCILWVMIVAKPGVQIKSPCLKLIKRIIDDIDEELRQKYEESKRNCDNELLEYKQKIAEWKTNGEKDNPPEEPVKPNRNLLYTSDTTKESLIELQKNNKNGVSAINDEISSLLRGFNQYKNGGNDEQYFLASWSKDRHTTTRKGDKEPTTIVPCHNILGTTQPYEVEKLLFKDFKSSNGLIERWLFVLSDYVQTGKLNREDIPIELIEHIEKLFKKLFELKNKNFSIAEEANTVFDQYFEELTRESKNQSTPELLRSYLLKQRSYIARLALVLHCLEDSESSTIKVNTINNAIKLSRYFIECFKRISKISLELKNSSKETYVLEYMRTKKLNKISPSKLHMANTSKIKSIIEAKTVLENLSNQGYGYIVAASNGCKFIMYDCN